MKESCPQKLDYRIVGKIFLLFLFRERDVGNHKYYLYPTNHILVFKENSDSSKLNGSDPKDKIRHRAPHFHTYLLKRTHKQHSDVEHGVFWNCEFCAFGVPWRWVVYRKRSELKAVLMNKSSPLQCWLQLPLCRRGGVGRSSVTRIISQSFRVLNTSQQILETGNKNICSQGCITATSRGQHCLDNHYFCPSSFKKTHRKKGISSLSS